MARLGGSRQKPRGNALALSGQSATMFSSSTLKMETAFVEIVSMRCFAVTFALGYFPGIFVWYLLS